MFSKPRSSESSFSQERWERVKQIVFKTLRLDTADREAYLHRACRDNPALRSEVESLLACESDASRLLTVPDSGRMASLLREHHADAAIGRRFGRYEIKAVLGYGGMGVVYRAEQEDPHREVALKVNSGGIHASPYQQRLFRREVQSLARLQHNGIAALYEAGTDEEGRQFFAMELVEGVPLTDYARDVCKRIEDRLHIFVRVCRAIHYAHQRGVIHRDIKPTNIIVRSDGQPKVLDFGLAKILENVEGAKVTTSLGKIHGTLSYMSPEQARGGVSDVDVRSDVYSLGVVLFEMLTGRRPHEVTHLTLPHAIETICHEQTPRAGSLDSSLWGDVDIIIGTALAKEAERRYRSADALADDVERFLSKEPIAARKPSAGYHLSRLAARHKLPATLVGLLVLAVSSLAVVATTMSIRLTEQRDAAEAARQQEVAARQSAEEVVEFLVGLFEKGDPHKFKESELTVRELIDAGAERVRTELADQPLVQARLMTALGSAYAAMSDFTAAETLLNDALSIRTRELGNEHPDVADTLYALGDIGKWTHAFDQGYGYLQRALQIRRTAFGETDPRITEVLDAMATNRFYVPDHELAERHFREVLARQIEERGPDSDEALQAQSNLGLTLRQLGQLGEAESLLMATLETQRRVLGDDVQTAFTLDHLAHVRFAQGKPLDAEAFERERVDMLRRILHDSHPTLTHALGNYAFLVKYNHGVESAEPILREVLAQRRMSLGDISQGVAEALTALAQARKEMGDDEEAIDLLSEALRIRRKLFGDSDLSVANSEEQLGAAMLAADRFDEAETHLLESYRILESLKDPRPAREDAVVALLIELYEKLGRPKAAEVWRQKNRDGKSEVAASH